MNNLAQFYKTEVAKIMADEFELENRLSCPKIEKVVINCGLGEATSSPKLIDEVAEQIAKIAGQKPVSTISKRSISAFKLRKGQKIGLKVTLRGRQAYSFLEKLFKVALPRLRDFRGLPKSNFDKAGNYTLGLKEINIFPETATMPQNKVRGLEITVVISSGDSTKSQRLLELLGMPFQKQK